jgi:hypothetical protein
LNLAPRCYNQAVSYRDDLEAAILRVDAATRDNAQLAEANRRLERELAEAKEWLGGPRRRILVIWGLCALCLVLSTIGALVLRSILEPPARVELPPRVQNPVPQVFGTIVADGPEVGRWTLNVTRCAQRPDGVELTMIGSDEHSIWLINDLVEIETPNDDFILEASHCPTRLAHEIHRNSGEPSTLSGYVALDCMFDGNSLHGRIEFKDCR